MARATKSIGMPAAVEEKPRAAAIPRDATASDRHDLFNDLVEATEGDHEDPKPRRWTRTEYYRLAEFGIISPEERLELIDGEIYRHMSPIGVPHSASMSLVRLCVERAFGKGYFVTSDHPLTIDDHGEPEPDLIVAVGTAYDYLDRHPRPSDVRLVIEVSDTSLRFDRKTKRSLYARAGIPEYWIVNLKTRQLVVHRSPSAKGVFSESLELGDGDAVTPLYAPEAAIAVSELFAKKR
jgi:Uma2 family endonuclease